MTTLLRTMLAAVPCALLASGCVAGARSPAPDPPTAAEVLATLPDGEARRRLILDCTGCHTFQATLAYPGAERRSEASWRVAAASMIERFGPHSGFPVIGPGRSADSTAAWLAAHLPAAAPPHRPLAPGLTGRADYREYLLPQPGELPHDVALTGGRMVITGMFTASMYLLDPETGEVTSEPTPAPNPRAIEVDAAGNWWVVLGGPRRLARRSPSGEWQSWDAGFYAHSVALDGRGGAWVNGHFTHEPELIRRIDPATGESRDYPLPAHPDFRTTPVPYEIRVAPDGAVWMSELQGNRMVRLDPATGAARAWSLPTSWSGPRRFDVAPDGTLWIPAYAANLLVHFDPATERWTEYPLPIPAAAPYIVRWDPARRVVWIGTGAADAVFRFEPRFGAFRVYPLPSRDQLVRHLVVDSVGGDVWLAPGSSPGSVPARVVRLRPLD